MYKRYVYKRGKRFGPYYYESYRDGDKIRKRYLGSQPQSAEKQEIISNLPNNSKRLFKNQQIILPILLVIIILSGLWLFYTNFRATGMATLDVLPVYTQGEAISGMLKLSLKAGELLPASSTLAVNMAGDERQFPLSELLTQGVTEGNFYAENTQLQGSGAGYGIAGTKTIYPEISFKLRITKEKGKEEETPAEEIETPSIPIEESPQEQTPTEAPETAQPEQTPLETPIEQPKQEKEENAEKPAKEEKSEEKGKAKESPVAETPAPEAESAPSAPPESSSAQAPSTPTESLITGSVVGESEKEERMIEASVSKDKPFAYTLGQGESAEIVQGSVRTSDNKKVDESVLNLQIQNNQVTITTSYFETEQGFGADFLSDETTTLDIPLERLNISAKQGTLAVSLSYNNAEIIQASADINVVQQNATEEPAENITNITEAPAENATNITQIENVTETNITINETNSTLPEINITIPENITEINITNATLQNITELNITELNVTELNITAKNLTLIRNIPEITINKNGNLTLNLSEYFEGAVYYEALEPENISIIIDAGNALIIPEANFTGIRNASITAYKENESLREDFVINVKDTNATIETIQYQAVIGQPVRWEKRIKPEKPENITLKLPASSKNITLKKIAQQKETPIEITGITGQMISGRVGVELELAREPKFISFFKKLFKFTGKLTGRAVESEEAKQAEQEIEVNISAEENAEYEIEYYTEAPYATEENLSGYKKMVVVSGPELNYTNILTFAAINEIIPVSRENAIKLYWYTTEAEAIKYGYLKGNVSETENKTQEGIIKVEIMPFTFDTNNNSLIDYVEWLTPHLSNQTFEIVIEISRAEHLDKDKVFISDIYNETYKLDDIWSEEIPDNDYARVTFSQNLTSQNDITIYPRVVQGNPTIIVYEKNKSEAIAEFSGIISNKYNKVLLTSLISSQDTFDLQVTGGSIEFDHIIDPSENQIIGINETTDYFLLWNQYNVYRVMKTGVQVNNPPNNWSQIKWCLQGTASGSTITKCVDGLSNWNWTRNTDNNTYAWLYGTNKITTALGNITIGVNYSLMDISTMIKIEIGAYNGLSADITNLNFSYEHHNITIMNDWQDDFVGGYLNNNWTEVELNKTLNTIVTGIDDNTFWIFDKVKGGDIRFNWTASNAYVWLKSNGEINTPVRLIVPAGTLAQGQIKKTTFHWVDAIGVQHNFAWGLDLTTSSTMGRRSNTANDMSIAIKANSTRGSDTDPILRVQIVNTAGITSGERLGLYFTDCTGGVLKTCAGRAIGNVTDDPASKFVPVEKQNGSTTGLFRFREASHASVIGGNQHSGVVGVTEHNPPAGAWAEGNTTDAYSVANFTGSSYNAHDFSLEYYGVAPSAKKTYVFAGTYNEAKPSWSGMHGQTGAILDVLPSPWNGSAVADHGISITSNTSALVTHIFTDDNDTDSNTTISYSDNESGTFTIPSGCNQITGGYNSYTFQSGEKGHIRTCSITGLAPNTLYFFKMVHNDSDGIAGNDILIEGPYYTHQARGAVHMHADVKDANDTTTDDEGDLKEDEAASIVTALVTGDGQYTLLRKARMQIDAWTPTAPANVTIDRIELRYQWAMNNVPETAQSLYRADPGTEPGMCTGSGGTNWTLVETLPNSVADWIAERSATMSGYTMAQLETLDLCLNNTNSGGSAASDVVAFDFITIVPVYTPASSGTGSPTATTDAATFIEETQAQLNGEVNTQGIAGKAYFEYGLNDSYGSYTPNSSGEYVYNTIASHAIEPIKYYRTITGLTAGTKYDYRVCLLAPPNASATCGANQNLTTNPAIPPNISIIIPVNNSNFSTTLVNINYTISNDAQACWWSNNSGTLNKSITCGLNITNQSFNEGRNIVVIYTNDSSNNINYSTRTFIVDTFAPNLTLVYPANTSYNYNVTQLNYTISNDFQACWWSSNNGVNNVTITCGTNITGANSSEGNNTWLVSANDSVGNVNFSRVTFVKDTTAPAVTIISPDARNYSTSSIEFNVSTNENSTCLYSLNSGLNNITMTRNATDTGFNATNSSIADGQYLARFYCNDTNGNWNRTESRAFGIDTIKPSINMTYPLNTSYGYNVIQLNYTTSDLNLQTCWWSSNNGVNNVTITCGTNITGANSSEGNNTWLVSANDSAGNINFSRVTFVKDTAAPVISLQSPKNNTNETGNNTITFIYNVSDVSNVTNCSLIINYAVNQTNITITEDINQTFIQLLPNNLYNWSVNCTDALNNLGASTNFVLNVSVPPPTQYCGGVYNSSMTDWNVSNNVRCDNETIIVTGNLIIATGGNLTLHNVTLNFTQNADGQRIINKTIDGGLFIYDNDNNASTTTDASFITSNDSRFKYNFWVNGRGGNDNFTLRNSRVSDAGFGANSQGIHLYNISNVVISGNNITNGRMHGLFLEISKNNNITSNKINVTGNTGTGIDLRLGSNSNTIQGNTINTNGTSAYGILFQVNSETNNVTSNTITTTGISGFGIYFTGGSDTNNISSNTITTSGNNGTGINVASSLNLIQGNTITTNGSNGTGILLDSAASSNISSNTITTSGDAARGISLLVNSNANNISGNTIKTNGSVSYGIYFVSSSNNIVINNIINATGVTTDGIYLFANSDTNNISYNNISNSGRNGISLELSGASTPDYNIFQENRIVYSNYSAITFIGVNISATIIGGLIANSSVAINSSIRGRNINITNVTIQNSTLFDFYISQNSSVVALNSTFNKSKINLSAGSLADWSNLTTKWFIQVNATNSSYQPLNQTNITAYLNRSNQSGWDIQWSELTAVTGLTTWREGTEFFENATARIYYQHNITGNSSGGALANYTGLLDLNRSFIWNLVLIGGIEDTIPPNISIIIPVNNSNFSTALVNINYTISNDAQACWWSNNSGTLNKSITCGLNITNQSFNEGRNIVVVYANDSSNNINYSTRTFIVDTFAPNLTLVYPANTSYNYNVTQLNYTISNDFQACWWSSNNGVNNVTITCGTNITGANSSEGNNTWLISANDSVGNVNFSRVTFVKDTISPNINITYPLNTTYAINVSWLNYTLSNSSQACWFSSNNGLTNQTITCGVNMTGVNSTQGTNTWRVWANDSVNNINQSNVTFVVDTISPNVNITYPLNTTYNINISILNYTVSTEAQSCKFSSNNGLTNLSIICGVNMSGVNSTQGSNTWRIYVNDSVNNINQSNVTFFIDSIFPLINIVSPSNNTNTSNVNININYTVSDTNLNTCWWSNNSGGTNKTLTCGANITGQSWLEGTNNVTIYVNDSLNNVNSSSVRFVVDTIKPLVTISNPQNITYTTSSIPFNFTLNEAGTCMYSLNNGVTNNTMTANASNTGFNATNASIADGGYTARAYCNDTAGNRNDSVSVAFSKDSNPPLVTIISPDARNYSTSSIEFNVSTNENSTCLYSLNSGLNNITMTRNTTDTGFNATNSSIADGQYLARFYCNDTNGNWNRTESRAFGIDTIKPSINMTYPLNTSYGYNVIQLNYTTSDLNLQTCWYSTNNGATNTTIICGNNATGLTSSEGSNTWLVSVNDSSNNINTSRTTFYKDTIFPNISITSPANSSNFSTNNVTINYTISDTGGISSCWYTNTSGLVNYSITCGQNISRIWNEGTNNITIYVNDSVNNLNSSSVRFVVDTTAPLLSITAPSNNSNISYNTAVNYTISDAGVGVQACLWSNNSGLSNKTITCGTNITGQGWLEGINNVTIWANDSLNNLNRSDVRFIIDTIKPNISIAYPANTSYGYNVTQLNYTISTDAQTCWWSSNNGVNNATITCGANITGANSSEGNNTWLVSANDSVNNINTSRVTFVKDTISPNINITYPRNITYNTNVSWLNYTVSTEAQTCWFSSNNGATNQTITCGVNMTGVNSTQGSNTWRIYVNDSVNNINQSNVTFVVDTIFPLINITSPANASNFSYTNVVINYTISDTNLQACWYTNTSGIVNKTITCGTNLTTLIWDEGVNNITIYANDTANNVNSSSVRFTVDTITPLVYLRSPANSSSWTSSNTITFIYNASDANNASNCSLIINNAVNATSTSITKDINQSFSINLNNGNYNWSVNCTDFVNNKGASETWQLNVNFVPPAEEAAPPSAGSAGGGGAGGTPPVRKFSVDKRDIIMKLKQGTSGDEVITITNDGEALLRFLISVDKLADYVLLKQDDYLFNLAPNNRKAVSLGFVIPDEMKPGVYLGRIIINADSIARVINVVLEVESKRVLFDAKVDIPARSREIEPGEKLSAQVTVFNLGELPNVNITRVYKIMDMEGNVILEKKEAIEIETQDSSMKTFDLPVLEEGTYVLAMEVLYEDSVTTSSQIFYVKAKKELEFPLKEDNLFYIIVFAVVLVFIIIMYLNYRSLARIREKLKKRVKR